MSTIGTLGDPRNAVRLKLRHRIPHTDSIFQRDSRRLRINTIFCSTSGRGFKTSAEWPRDNFSSKVYNSTLMHSRPTFQYPPKVRHCTFINVSFHRIDFQFSHVPICDLLFDGSFVDLKWMPFTWWKGSLGSVHWYGLNCHSWPAAMTHSTRCLRKEMFQMRQLASIGVVHRLFSSRLGTHHASSPNLFDTSTLSTTFYLTNFYPATVLLAKFGAGKSPGSSVISEVEPMCSPVINGVGLCPQWAWNCPERRWKVHRLLCFFGGNACHCT